MTGYLDRAKRRMEIFDRLPAVVRQAVNDAEDAWVIECLPKMVRKYGATEAARMILAGEGSEVRYEYNGAPDV